MRRPTPINESYADYLQRKGELPRLRPRRFLPDPFAEYTWNVNKGLYERKWQTDSIDSDHSDIDYLFDPDDDQEYKVACPATSDSDEDAED